MGNQPPCTSSGRHEEIEAAEQLRTAAVASCAGITSKVCSHDSVGCCEKRYEYDKHAHAAVPCMATTPGQRVWHRAKQISAAYVGAVMAANAAEGTYKWVKEYQKKRDDRAAADASGDRPDGSGLYNEIPSHAPAAAPRTRRSKGPCYGASLDGNGERLKGCPKRYLAAARASGEYDKKAALRLLDLGLNASRKDIKRCYTRLAVQCHPDKFGDSNLMRELNAAHKAIKDLEG